MTRTAVIGDYMLDIICRGEPVSHDSLHVKVSDASVAPVAGGTGTVLRYLSRYGNGRVSAHGYIGNDEVGGLVLSLLERDGIDCAGVLPILPGTPIRAYLLSSPGPRLRLDLNPNEGGDDACVPSYPTSRLLSSTGVSVDLLVVDFAKSLDTCIDAAAFDNFSRSLVITKRRDLARYSQADVVVVNSIEQGGNRSDGQRRLVEQATGLRHGGMPKAVVVTGAERGAAMSYGDSLTVFVPSPRVNLVNDVGAGDILGAAMLTALQRGDNVEMALRVATCEAATSVSDWISGRLG
jgi:sugar/nucleoside kinase (ribokinase family)